MIEQRKIGSRIQECRKQHRLTVEQLAGIVGIRSERNVSKYAYQFVGCFANLY